MVGVSARYRGTGIMEKILVGLEAKRKTLWPVIYALSLAKRMDVRIDILLVDDSAGSSKGKSGASENVSDVKDQLESMILNGRSEGILIDYYITGGAFTNELIKFIQEKKINLLILGLPDERKRTVRNIPELLKEIRLRTNCRIEVVNQKTDKPEI